MEIFITGGTGYIGRALIPVLLQRRHHVRALVRPGSERKLPSGCQGVIGDALNVNTFRADVRPGDTFIQLVGTPHPSPAKAQAFQDIDAVSVRASVQAASEAGVAHFIYLSVAQPAPVMRVYQGVRAEGENVIRESGLRATFLRPWYVLGPGHRWPAVLLPVYALLKRLPATRESALRLDLMTCRQMINALVAAVEEPPQFLRVWDVPNLKRAEPDPAIEGF